MRIGELTATADLIGRRVLVRWTFFPQRGETIADIPPVTIRRKERDFAFPALRPGDPYLVYDSSAFPPAPAPALHVADLPDRELFDGANRITERTVTVAAVDAGRSRELLRHTIRTILGADRRLLSQQVELLDLDPRLRPCVPSYYELDSPHLEAGTDRRPYRATAASGEKFGLNRTLYELIPSTYRRHDTVARTPDDATGLIEEAASGGGQLRRLIDVFGMGLDAIRSSAEDLRILRDPAVGPPLPAAACAVDRLGADRGIRAATAAQRDPKRSAPVRHGRSRPGAADDRRSLHRLVDPSLRVRAAHRANECRSAAQHLRPRSNR